MNMYLYMFAQFSWEMIVNVKWSDPCKGYYSLGRLWWSLFCIFEINVCCVAIFDLVHDVEAMFHLP